MSMSLELRAYRESDANDIVATWDASARLAYPFCDEAFFQQGARDIIDVFLPNAATTVCLDGERLVGFVSMLGNTMGGIFVHPEHMNRGIGRKLVDHVARERDALDLTVFTKNHIGRRFYERYGFHECGRPEIHQPTGHELLHLCWKRGA